MYNVVRSLFFCAVVACLQLRSAEHLCSEQESKQALRELFTSLDSDGDGQIRKSEASMYIKTHTGQALKVVQAEAEQLMASLDGSDTDSTISIEELEKNLDLRGEVLQFCFNYALDQLPVPLCSCKLAESDPYLSGR